MWQYTGKTRPSFAIEPQSGQESVWDYPRPPVIVEDSRRVEVRLGELIIADTRSSLRVLETASPPTFYIPPGDIDLTRLQKASGQSICEWKGVATYWSLITSDRQIDQVGWSYPNPNDRFTSIRNYIAFYPAKLTCLVNGEEVQPQGGGFYGGWVTSEIIGPWKGEAGSAGW